MSGREYSSGNELQNKLLKGVDLIVDNVASTLGPRGRNVILHAKGKKPIITKDGVTVAKFVQADDPTENLGVQVIKQASAQTNEDAGDGTTTAAVIARAIFRETQKYLVAGVSPVEIKRGIDKTVKVLSAKIKEAALPIRSIEDIENIATISANGDTTIGKLISTAVDKIGKDGSITIQDSTNDKSSLQVVEGFRFDGGYASNLYITDEKKNAVLYDNPYFLVTDHSIEMVEELLPVLELIARESRPLIVVADKLEGQALAALIANAAKGTLKVASIKIARFGEERRNLMKDLCASVGATFISRVKGMDIRQCTLEHLGQAKSIEILKNFTTILEGAGDYENIEERIEALREEIKQTDSLTECERLQERITRLSSGAAIIRVGAPTEVEMNEKKHRFEDALEAVKSAQEEGIVAGGGTTLVKLAMELDEKLENEEQDIGRRIVILASKEPVRQMAHNAGLSPDLILREIENGEENIGFNFATEEMEDLIAAGVIDPAKVTRSALQNACSAATTLFNSGHSIVEI